MLLLYYHSADRIRAIFAHLLNITHIATMLSKFVCILEKVQDACKTIVTGTLTQDAELLKIEINGFKHLMSPAFYCSTQSPENTILIFFNGFLQNQC